MVRAELEADLVVALAGRAVRDGVGADGLRRLHHPLDDGGARERRAEQVLALVDHVGADGREDEVAHERLAQIGDHALRGAGLRGLLGEAVELLGLADVGAPGDDLAAVGLLEPREDDARVEPAGVGEDDLLDGLLGHAGRPLY